MTSRYDKIRNTNVKSKTIDITTYIPTPTKVDYTNGYIIRCFIQKTNDVNAPIYEISPNMYDKFSESPQYIAVILDWRLTGPPSDIRKSNKASIGIVLSDIPKMRLYLPNLLQFHKK